jgi:hypothetical protein
VRGEMAMKHEKMSTEPNSEKILSKVASNLKKRGFGVSIANSVEEAKSLLREYLSGFHSVGMGDSVTLKQMDIMATLKEAGVKVVDPFDEELALSRLDPAFYAMCKEALNAEVFLASVNAVTMDGLLVSIDRAGNRICGTVFGPRSVVLVIGRNKVVPDFTEAYARLKTVIVPAHAKAKGRATPCEASGACCEYRDTTKIDTSRDRLCSIMLVLEGKPMFTNIQIILLDADLGLGWDPHWDEERIERIRENYLKLTPRRPIQYGNENPPKGHQT